MNTFVVKVNNATQTVKEYQVVTKDGEPTIIQAISDVNYQLVNQSTGFAPDYIVTRRESDDLLVSMDQNKQEVDLIIEDYYDDKEGALLGQAQSGQYHYYIPDTGETSDYVFQLLVDDVEEQELGGEALKGPLWESLSLSLPLWVAGSTALAAGIVVVSSNHDSSTPKKDTTTTSKLDSVEIGNGDDYITADEVDNEDKVTVTVGLKKVAAAGYTVVVNGEEKLLTDQDITAGEVDVKVDAPAEGDKLTAQ